MTLVIVIITMALVFDYINGFHDAANSIATIVSTKVLTPFQAVVWAAMFNFTAFFVFKDHAVANTISKTVFENFITLEVILSGLIAAIAWNLLTWWFGIPSSSSHTLIGGFAGAAITHAYMTKGLLPIREVVDQDSIVITIFFIFLAPIIGVLVAAYITLITIQRNYWKKLSLMIFSALITFFGFNYFMNVKLNENLKKFYQVEKLSQSISKEKAKGNAVDNNLQAQYQLALSNFEKSQVYLKDYTIKGNEYVVSQIANTVNLKPVEIQKQIEIVKKFTRYEAAKKEVYFDSTKLDKLKSIDNKINSLRVHFVMHDKLGDSLTAANVAKQLHFGDKETQKFIKAYRIDPKRDLRNTLDDADNRALNYGMMIFVFVFAVVYFYVEKFNKPTASKMNNMFKKLQLFSSAAFSLGHGGSDAQKVMGIIGAALIANGNIVDFKEIPNWVPLACYGAIGLGTLSGGWKIVKTMGSRITKVTPLEGVGAETAGAITLFMTAQMGIPVSTTHTITGSIIGVGATKRLSAVRWGITRNLLFAWIVTIPISALIAGLVLIFLSLF